MVPGAGAPPAPDSPAKDPRQPQHDDPSRIWMRAGHDRGVHLLPLPQSLTPDRQPRDLHERVSDDNRLVGLMVLRPRPSQAKPGHDGGQSPNGAKFRPRLYLGRFALRSLGVLVPLPSTLSVGPTRLPLLADSTNTAT